MQSSPLGISHFQDRESLPFICDRIPGSFPSRPKKYHEISIFLPRKFGESNSETFQAPSPWWFKAKWSFLGWWVHVTRTQWRSEWPPTFGDQKVTAWITWPMIYSNVWFIPPPLKCWLPPPPFLLKNNVKQKKQRFPSWFEIHSASSGGSRSNSPHETEQNCIKSGLLIFYDQRSLCLLCRHSGVAKNPFVFPLQSEPCKETKT